MRRSVDLLFATSSLGTRIYSTFVASVYRQKAGKETVDNLIKKFPFYVSILYI